jgi:hypothetical protein
MAPTLPFPSHSDDEAKWGSRKVLYTSLGVPVLASPWYEKTRPIHEEIERLAATRENREEIAVSFRNLKADVVEGQFVLRHRGRVFYTDHYATGQLGRILNIGGLYPQKLIGDGTAESAEMMQKAFEHAAHGVNAGSAWVLRIDNHNCLRAILPEASNFVSNEWYLRVVESAIPEGRLINWRGDDWTIYGNILLPGTLTQQSDSLYGAMISLSNCEIGKRALRQRPSIFRSICTNGAICRSATGQAFWFNRRTKLNQGELEQSIRLNLREQIPVAQAAISDLMSVRAFQTQVSMKLIIAAVAGELDFSRRLASAVLTGWWLEKRQTPEYSNTLFALVNAITRAGQAQRNNTWVRFDEIGGALARMPRSDWEELVARAAALRARDVDSAFAPWAVEA